MIELTVEQWLAELEKATKTKGTGLTANELAEKLNMNRAKVMKDVLHPANKQGRLIVEWDFKQSIDGRMMSVPTYRFRKKT